MSTKQRILDTALSMFNEHGERSVTTNHIAARLEISPGNLYYHFKNKQAIIFELFLAYEQRVSENLQVPEDRQLTTTDKLNYLKDGISVGISSYQGELVGVEMAITVELRVVETSHGFKGDTATAGTKPAKLETGITIQVPMFINEGDIIKVDTRSGSYLERVS